MKLAMGQYDDPLNQKQPIFYLQPYMSNIAVFGAPMSGKTTFIKTLLVRLHENMNNLPGENIYLLDFGGNIGDYGDLRNVCACFDDSNEENIKRVFKIIEKRLEQNAKQLSSRSFCSVAEKNPEKAPTHIYLIIENINAFLSDERYSSYQERLMRFCRDGLSKGLTVVITANDLTGIGRLMANFGQKIAFEMPANEYYEIFNAKVNKPMKVPGRGVVNIDSGNFEFQCFMPFAGDDDDKELAALKERTDIYPNDNIMASFSDVLTKDNFAQYCAKGYSLDCGKDKVAIGLDYYEHRPVAVNIDESRVIGIYGKSKFGKTNLLNVLLNGIKNEIPEARFVLFDDGRKQLLQFSSNGEKCISENSEYFTSAVELSDYLYKNGYDLTRKPDRGGVAPPVAKVDNPFTVFVLQGKSLYRGLQDTKYLMVRTFQSMITEAIERKFLFIFSDIPSGASVDIRTDLNDVISSAFLLNDIGDFVAETGDKTVFGGMGSAVKELKSEYAKCSIGDGYYFNVETDELYKLKFIKA